jgi:hypothetical protein
MRVLVAVDAVTLVGLKVWGNLNTGADGFAFPTSWAASTAPAGPSRRTSGRGEACYAWWIADGSADDARSDGHTWFSRALTAPAGRHGPC